MCTILLEYQASKHSDTLKVTEYFISPHNMDRISTTLILRHTDALFVLPSPFEAQGAPLEPKAIRVIGFGSWLAEGLRASASNDMHELSISASREYAAKSVVQGNQRCKAGERCNATDRASVVHSNQPGKRHRATKSNG